MTDFLSYASLIAGTFLLAGLVKGVIGPSLPTVVMGLLSLVMPPAQAAPLLLVRLLVTVNQRGPGTQEYHAFTM